MMHVVDQTSCPQVRNASTLSPSVASPSTSTSSGVSSPSLDTASSSQWYISFQLPIVKMPRELINCLENEIRPSTALRREMVRIVCDDIFAIMRRPGRHAIKKIAEKIVGQFPKCFRDEIEGIPVGSGYDSLLAQLEYRLDNMNRGIKRPLSLSTEIGVGDVEEPEGEGMTTPKIVKQKDSYGCVNWQPNIPQDENRLADLKFKQNRLKEMSHQISPDAEIIKSDMIATYCLQR